MRYSDLSPATVRKLRVSHTFAGCADLGKRSTSKAMELFTADPDFATVGVATAEIVMYYKRKIPIAIVHIAQVTPYVLPYMDVHIVLDDSNGSQALWWCVHTEARMPMPQMLELFFSKAYAVFHHVGAPNTRNAQPTTRTGADATGSGASL